MALSFIEKSRRHLNRTFVSLNIKDFRFLTLSSLGMGYGQWFQMVGLPLIAYDMTGSGAQMGLITALRGGIVIVASPIGGILSDKFSRRAVVIWSSAMGAIQAGVLAAILLAGFAQVWHLYVFSLLEGFATGINQPARIAFVRDVVDTPDLPNAVAINSIATNGARVTGPPLAGAIYGFFGGGALFLALAGVKIMAMALTMLISKQTRQVVSSGSESALSGFWNAIRYCVQDHVLLTLLLVSYIPAFLIYPYFQMLPFFAYEVLGTDATGVGWLGSALGWGSIVGLLIMAFAGNIPRKGLIMFGTLVIYTLFIIGFSQSQVFALSMMFLAVGGVFHSPAMALNHTLLLLRAREDMTGRVMAINGLSQGFLPLGLIPLGFAVDRWGAPNSVGLFIFAAFLLITVLAIFSPDARKA